MAGGIDWFRWHHGSVTDPKFQLVARKAGVSLPDVLAVWTYLLESASANEVRGRFSDIDCEAVDCLFGFNEGATQAIVTRMVERGLITDECHVVAWEKRQPKREREEDKSTTRVQAFRQKQRNETPGNATERQETPRGEESREESSLPTVEKTKTARKRAAAAPLVSVDDLVAEGVGRQHAIDWIATRKAKTLPLTRTAWDDTKAEALKAGITAPEAVALSAANAWGGFRASWVAADAKNTRHGAGLPPVTVPSDAADKTAAYLAQQSARVHDPPPDIGERLRAAKQAVAVGGGSLRVVA